MAHDPNHELFVAALGDRDAAANYRRLADLNPDRRDEWLQRAAESDASASRNLQARARLYGRRKSAAGGRP